MTSTPTHAPTPENQTAPVLLLLAFVTLVFCTGTAEFLVSGVLPQMAGSLGVGIAEAGRAVTAYALGVAVGGPVITAATARVPRKRLALGLSFLFIAGMAITVLSPNLAWVLVGRVVSASSQATLFAVALTTAADALGHHRSGQAVAIVGSGLTIATVLGVPLGVLLGGQNWRLPFVVVALLAVFGAAALAATMPSTEAPATSVRDELGALLKLPVLLAVGTTVMGFAGVGVVFTYLVPLLGDITGLASGWIPVLLLLYGLGGFVGNIVSGRLTDLSLVKTLLGALLALLTILALFPLGVSRTVPAVILVLLLGLVSTASIAPLQALVLRHASDAPTLALSVNVGAFNLANAIGATVGGWAVLHGKLESSGWFGAIFAVAGLALAIPALWRPRRMQERAS